VFDLLELEEPQPFELEDFVPEDFVPEDFVELEPQLLLELELDLDELKPPLLPLPRSSTDMPIVTSIIINILSSFFIGFPP
jgi:hypothetical protein